MEIKYEQLNSIGMELFRKNNSTFLKSNLSPMMSKIIKSANSPYIENTESEYYMKSGTIPNRIYYIYSNELAEKCPDKTHDIVRFNNEICVWFYSNNAINMIDKNPVDTIMDIYNTLIFAFTPDTMHISFVNKENYIAQIAMSLNLIVFLHETYGALDIEECKQYLIEHYLDGYTRESCKEFVDDICDKCTKKGYFSNREYLDSYLLLKRKPIIKPV